MVCLAWESKQIPSQWLLLEVVFFIPFEAEIRVNVNYVQELRLKLQWPHCPMYFISFSVVINLHQWHFLFLLPLIVCAWHCLKYTQKWDVKSNITILISLTFLEMNCEVSQKIMERTSWFISRRSRSMYTALVLGDELVTKLSNHLQSFTVYKILNAIFIFVEYLHLVLRPPWRQWSIHFCGKSAVSRAIFSSNFYCFML